MIRFDDLPSIQAPAERLADWLEYCALTSKARTFSRAELISTLGISGTVDAEGEGGDLDEVQAGEAIEAKADDVFGELEDRLRSCGGDGGAYPFAVGDNLLELNQGQEISIYVFLIVVAFWSKEKNTFFKDGAKLFEDLSAEAAKRYLGAPHSFVRAHVFGFPRRILPAGFQAALDTLCREIGEGVRANNNRPKAKDQKDAKLDIVAWRNFADGRQGKLIAFGQCASGLNWQSKTTEMGYPHDWWTKWVVDRPATWPIKMFFVPHRVSRCDWFNTCADAGLLFDRCRISHLAAGCDPELERRCSDWTSRALQTLQR